MLLFQKRFHEGLVSGAVRLTFRQWAKPHVKPGGRYRCHPIGVLEVDRVDHVPLAEVTDEQAQRAGFSDKATLVVHLNEIAATPVGEASPLWRVELHHAGDE